MPRASFDYDFVFRITGDREVVASLDTMIKKGDQVVQGTKMSSKSMSAFSDDISRAISRLSTNQSKSAQIAINFMKTSRQVTSNLMAEGKAIIEQSRRRGELLDSEQQRLIEINSKIDQHTNFIQNNSKALNVNSKAFEVSNRIIASNTSFVRQAEDFTGKYSSAVIQAKNSQQTFNNKLGEFKSRASVVTNEMRVLARDMQANKVSTQAGTASWAMYEQQLERIINELRQFIVAQDLSTEEAARATAVLANMTDTLGNAQRGFAGTRGTMLGLNKVTSGANQIMLSFGDIIQDSAQFSFGFAQGARAIGNNIAFAAEQFVIMRANLAASQGQAITFGATMRALGASLMGPIGIVVAINTVVTAITMIATSSQKAEKDITSLDEKTKSFSDSLRELSKALTGDEFGLFTDDQILSDIAKLGSLTRSLDAVRTSGGKFGTFISSLGMGIGGAITSTKSLSDVSEELIGKYDELANQSKILNGLNEEQRQLLARSISQDIEKIQALELLRDQQKKAIPGAREYYDTIDEINNITKELEVSEAKRSLGINDMSMTQEMARAKYIQLKDEILSMNIGVELQNTLLIELADAFSSVAEKASDAADSIDRVSIAQGLLSSSYPDIISFGERYAEQLFNQLNNEKLILEQTVASGKATEEQLERYLQLVDAVNLIADAQANTAKKIEDGSKRQRDAFLLISSGVSSFISSLTSLNQANADQSEAAAKRQFETQKKLSYASSVVAGAEAFVKALDEKPPYNFILAGLVAASTAAQLATISKQQFNYTGGGGESKPSGQGITIETTPRTSLRSPVGGPAYTPRNQMAPAPIYINNELKADSEKLYIITKTGERKVKAKQL